jgi:hypothetical protein
MKTTITILALVLSIGLYAQDQKLAIGKTTVDGDALVDFGTELRGMVIAPIDDVTTMTPAPSAGTIAFDGETGSFRYFDGSSWSTPKPDGDDTGVDVASGTDTFKQLIGAETSTATGVVIFGEDSGETQALVLPKLANGNLRFSNPVTGLIYYDTVLKAVMVYNGNGWTRF